MPYKIQKQYRKPGYDYTMNNAYFITICTQNRIYHFGRVENCEMILSPIGKIVAKFWSEIPKHFKNIILDNWIIMPNHLHGIIIIQDPNQSAFHDCIDLNRRNAPRRVLENHTDSIFQKNTPRRVPTGIQPLVKGSISSITNHFKGNIKRYCNKNGFEHFAWQSRFYDRIIRNEQELYNIQNYIYNNPLNWNRDRNNLENLLM